MWRDRHREPTRPVPEVVAGSDCERCRAGWVTQPANTLSSLAYVVAGASLGHQASRRDPDRPTAVVDGAYAAAVAGVGVGSVAYHGPAGTWGRWLHDAALVTLAAVIAVGDLAAVRGHSTAATRALAAAPLAAALAAGPATTEPAQALTGAVAVAADVLRARTTGEGPPRWALLASIPVWSAGVTFQVLGRTGGPLCRPGSRFQPHAAWHVCSALGLWLRAQNWK